MTTLERPSKPCQALAPIAPTVDRIPFRNGGGDALELVDALAQLGGGAVMIGAILEGATNQPFPSPEFRSWW
jgi:hypothetical protein